MENFARHYLKFLADFFTNIWLFIKNIGLAIGKYFGTDVAKYFADFGKVSNTFNAFDWIIGIIVIIINVGFVAFILVKLFQLLRKYVRFVRREIEKDQLLGEMADLNQRVVELTHEKNQIFSLKMESLGFNPDDVERLKAQQDGIEETRKESRFAKLIEVDKNYSDVLMDVVMTEEDTINLYDLVTRFINFSASELGLFYDRRTVSSFFSGMATSKIIILEGISGTGKTSLPYAMGKFFQHDAAIISVQPSWRDRAEMIGYLNEFTKRFNETDFLKAVYETTYRRDLNFIVLDEMNLARIEYYFAEFLSVMEMPNTADWKIDVVPVQEPNDPKNMMAGKIPISQNIWFVGTANKDDSTFTITDKVYDRATPVEMNRRAPEIHAPATDPIRFSYDYLITLFKKAYTEHPLSQITEDKLLQLDDFVSNNFKITFGNRIMKQIRDFVPVFVACGGTEFEALDFMVARKIFRKFEMLNLPFLQEELGQLVVVLNKLFGEGIFKDSLSLINELRRQF